MLGTLLTVFFAGLFARLRAGDAHLFASFEDVTRQRRFHLPQIGTSGAKMAASFADLHALRLGFVVLAALDAIVAIFSAFAANLDTGEWFLLFGIREPAQSQKSAQAQDPSRESDSISTWRKSFFEF